MSSTKQFKTLRAISHCGDRVEKDKTLSLTQDEAERYGDAVQLIAVEAAADADTSTTTEASALVAGEEKKAKDSDKKAKK